MIVICWGVYKEHSESGQLERKQMGRTEVDEIGAIKVLIEKAEDSRVEWITIDMDKTK